MREPGSALDAAHDVREADAGQDRDAVPLHLAVQRELVAALRERLAEQLAEGAVGELRLLQAEDIGGALIQPREQPRGPLPDRVHIPRRDAHGATVAPLLTRPVSLV